MRPAVVPHPGPPCRTHANAERRPLTTSTLHRRTRRPRWPVPAVPALATERRSLLARPSVGGSVHVTLRKPRRNPCQDGSHGATGFAPRRKFRYDATGDPRRPRPIASPIRSSLAVRTLADVAPTPTRERTERADQRGASAIGRESTSEFAESVRASRDRLASRFKRPTEAAFSTPVRRGSRRCPLACGAVRCPGVPPDASCRCR